MIHCGLVTSPSHYLHQCRLIINGARWHLVEGSFREAVLNITQYTKCFKITYVKILSHLPLANEWVHSTRILTKSWLLRRPLRFADRTVNRLAGQFTNSTHHNTRHTNISISFIQFNSLGPSNAYTRQWTRPSSVQIMACRLLCAKPFSDLTHLPLVPHICVSESGQHWFR